RRRAAGRPGAPRRLPAVPRARRPWRLAAGSRAATPNPLSGGGAWPPATAGTIRRRWPGCFRRRGWRPWTSGRAWMGWPCWPGPGGPKGATEVAVEEHRRRAQGRTVNCVVVTVSDTRGPGNDAGGDLIAELLAAAGHRVISRHFVADDVEAIRRTVQEALAQSGVDAVLLSGGTGIAPRDVTPEAVRPLLDRELPGFAEIFRMLSYHEVGPAGMLSRALAGTAAGAGGACFVACLPGSPHGVRLAVERPDRP